MNFYYECAKCKNKIPGYFDSSKDNQVKWVFTEKGFTYVFECKDKCK